MSQPTKLFVALAILVALWWGCAGGSDEGSSCDRDEARATADRLERRHGDIIADWPKDDLEKWTAAMDCVFSG